MTNFISKFLAKKHHKNLPHQPLSEKLRSKVTIRIKKLREVQSQYLKKHSKDKNNQKGIGLAHSINRLKWNKKMKTFSKMQRIVMWLESQKTRHLSQKKNSYKKINLLLLKVYIYLKNNLNQVKILRHTSRTETVQNINKQFQFLKNLQLYKRKVRLEKP